MKQKVDAFLLDIEAVKQKYDITDLEIGLSSEEVAKRYQKYGPNKLMSEKPSKWKFFFRQFNNIIIYILMLSALITFFIGHTSDAIIIALVVLVNALIGYYQESNASDALEKIKQMLSTQATVYRDGMRIDIEAESLVIGDVVFLEAGDRVPADLRIVESDNLRIQESALTGEADSVEKIIEPLTNPETPLAEQINLAFASTSVTNGSGVGIVIATGQNTEIGKISTEVKDVEERKTPLMQEIDHLGKGITYVIIGVSIALFLFSLFLKTYSLSVLTLAVITMIVGSIPEGLPATTSVVLAMGVNDMAKHKHTIVKTLPAVETLGSVDVIATDKTGTLTKNEMTIKDILIDKKSYTVTGDGYAPFGDILENLQPVELDHNLRLFLEAGFEANDTVLMHQDETWIINGEPTDGSFLTLYHKVFPIDTKPECVELDMIPFDSDYRYIAKLVNIENQGNRIYIKGSPDKLFPMAQQADNDFDEAYWSKQVRDLSKQGKRVVAVGYQDVPDDVLEITHELCQKGITLIGIAGIIDPPREEVIDALKDMRRAGVEIKMITGDHPLTAQKIGEQLGIAEHINVITGAELDMLSEAELAEVVLTHQVFARTTPLNKLQIVEALQKNEKITAMTGDGVNDAPALKRADIGVAMGIKGTDVAKDAADMILTDDNFATMGVAIREGRRIYDNIKKSILFLLPTSFAEGLIIAFTILMQKEMPLQPTQLLWINMVSAITIQFAFIFEPAEAGIMNRKPRKTGSRLLSKHDVFQMTYVSIIIALISIVAYEWISLVVNQATASTMMINIIVISKIFYLFTIRTGKFAFSRAFFTNKKAFLIIAIMITLQLLLTYVPFMQTIFYTEEMSIIEWLIAIGAGVIILAVAEFDKIIRYFLKKKHR